MSVLSDLHEQRLRRLPCVACFVLNGVRNFHQIELHHIESVRHDFSDFLQLPVCWDCHQGMEGIHGRQRGGWERSAGVTQLQLLGVTNSMLLADRAALVGG